MKISQNALGQIFDQWSTADMAKLAGAGQRAMGIGTGGNKDQLWFSSGKKQVVRMQTVVFAREISYTMVIMPRP